MTAIPHIEVCKSSGEVVMLCKSTRFTRSLGWVKASGASASEKVAVTWL